MKKRYLDNILIGSFVFFFVYTSIYKMINIPAFRFNIARTGVFPTSWLTVLPYIVVGMELCIVGFLLLKKKTGVILFALALLSFSMYITYLYNSGRYEVCGCGGILNGLDFKYHIAINLSFLFLAILVLYKYKSHKL